MRTSALVVLAAAGFGLQAMPVAHASAGSESHPTVVSKPVGNAPDCVRVWHTVGTITKTGYARNDCSNALNIRIVWAFGVDGPCSTVSSGSTISHKIPRGPRNFDGASTC
ncbi:hypothetical protein [Streptosporangium sp. KLBMP 9127]|nr:hypothetical protein [Streptosporangium sp. KLBMP 9127]